jgi:hypothetical protein
MFAITSFAQSSFSDFEHNTTSYGNYLYAGLDANILNNRSITALNGVYNYTGNNASLLVNRNLTATSAVNRTIAFSELPFAGLDLVTQNKSYTYIGLTSDLLVTRNLIALNGVYTYTGNNAVFSQTLTALNGVYSYTGNNASLLKTYKVYAINGEYGYVGFTSRRKIFIGNWEIGEDFVDVWTCQDDNTSSVWTKQTPPTATWN